MVGKETLYYHLPPYEQFSSSLEKNIFSGTSPLKTFIHFIDKKTPLKEGLKTDLLPYLVWLFDQYEIKESKDLWEKVYDSSGSEIDLARLQLVKEGLLEEAGNILEDERVVAAGPLFGSYSFLAQLEAGHPDKVFGLFISGTTGVETGLAHRLDDLPKAVSNKDNTVIVVDDLIDSVGTLAQIGLKRRELRLKEQGEEMRNEDLSLVTRLKEASGRLDELDENGVGELPNEAFAYYQLVQLMREEKILLGAAFSKNEPFLKALKLAAENDSSKWGQRQLALLEHTCQIKGRPWVVGAEIVDAGISWFEDEGNPGVYQLLDNEAKGKVNDLGLWRVDLPLTLRLGASTKPFLAIKGKNKKERLENLGVLQQQFADFLSDWILPF